LFVRVTTRLFTWKTTDTRGDNDVIYVRYWRRYISKRGPGLIQREAIAEFGTAALSVNSSPASKDAHDRGDFRRSGNTHSGMYNDAIAPRAPLAPASDPTECAEQALSEAIRSVNAPLLTQLYLETHTLRQALALGISVPTQ
jgi:hypothetical protein